MKTIYVLLPAYNESKNIGNLINSWIEQEEKLKRFFNLNLMIIPIDDKSTDNTKEVLKKFELRYNNVKPIYHDRNQNLGGVLKTGFKFFNKNANKEDIIFVMDADNTHDPQFAIEMLNNLYRNKKDCIIASRYCNSSETIGVPKHRNFLSNGAKFYYEFMLKIPNVKDYTCGYRAYTYEIIDKAFDVYGDKFIEETGFSCMMEIIYKLHLIGAKIGETGFILRYDNKIGESKMKILKTVKNSIFTAFKLRYHTRKIVRQVM